MPCCYCAAGDEPRDVVGSTNLQQAHCRESRDKQGYHESKQLLPLLHSCVLHVCCKQYASLQCSKKDAQNTQLA
jgi:hypothetical protein